mgnify:CR=1 FL=1
MKLEIKHLENYLSHKLMCVRNGSNPVELVGLRFGNEAVNNELWIWKEGKQYLTGYLYECKPILRPLSDFADIDSDALCDLNCDMSDQIQISEFASKRISISSLSAGSFDILTANKVDVFGLIDQGLALPLI